MTSDAPASSRRGVSFWAGPARRVCLAVYLGGFSAGVVTHVRELLAHGWRLHGATPAAVHWYWTSLTALDALAIALLLLRPRAGLLLALAIMVSDVAVNSYAALTFLRGAFRLEALALQAGFLLFILITTPWLLRDRRSGSASGGRGDGLEDRRRGRPWP